MTTPAAHFTDEEIQAVIDHYDDPEHPDALTISDARELLATLQETLEDEWDEYTTAIREDTLSVARDTGSLVVFEDPERTRWTQLLDAVQLYNQVERTILRVIHHQAAKRLTERDFDGTDPLVVRKPQSALAGQRLVEAVVNALRADGLTADEAWTYYAIDLRGYDADEWLERGGYEDRITVADTVERARDKLGE